MKLFRGLPLVLVLLLAFPLFADESELPQFATDEAIQKYAAENPGCVIDTGKGFAIYPPGKAVEKRSIEPTGESFGLDYTSSIVGAVDFVPREDTQLTVMFIPWRYAVLGSNARAYATVDPPHGSKIYGMHVSIQDTSATGQVTLDFFKVNRDTDATTLLATYSSGVAATPGTVRNHWITIPTERINTWDYMYVFRLIYSELGSSLGAASFVVWTKREMATAPASASFSDVPSTYWAFRAIESLKLAGVTTGYGDGTFKPDNPITRAEMATFLARALGLGAPSDLAPINP